MRHLLLPLLFAAACGGKPAADAEEPPARGSNFEDTAGEVTDADADGDALAASATLHRLTDAQWRASVETLTGVAYAGDLPGDYVLYGFSAVGAAEIAVSPLELEQYETAAWAVAEATLTSDAAVEDWLGCAFIPPLGQESASEDTCLRAGLTAFTERAWRRPVTTDELDALVDLEVDLYALLRDPLLSIRGAMAAVLLSPHFVFRVELGEPDPSTPGDHTARRYTDYEVAERLAYLLTGTTPDDTLLAAAAAGELTTDDGVRYHAWRLLEADLARPALTGFFEEYMDLGALATVDKSQDLFPELTPTLRESMLWEARRLFQSVTFERDVDFRHIFTTNDAWIDAELAALYRVELDGEGRQGTWLNLQEERGGILGRAAFLTINSHATINSPTHRGKFVRTQLLCGDVPAPPAGVNTSLEDTYTDGTLRELLEVHMTDPSCASCHQMMDPIGFGLEHFDPIGRWRALDNGFPVDASGDLDGAPFYGAAELGDALVEHPDLLHCLTRQLFRHGTGHLEQRSEEPTIDAITAEFEAGGARFKALVIALVTSEGFRTAAAPENGACDTDGDTRSCSTDCGQGTEVCVEGAWTACDAPAPAQESCDGADQDCDGAVDEAVTESCELGGDPGYRICGDGAWDTCRTAAGFGETCDGLDDDDDGLVDEELEVAVTELTFAELTEAHGSCDPTADAVSDACHAAANRHCAATGCAATGFPGAALALESSRLAVTCLDDTEASVVSGSYAELSAIHGGCTESNPIGPDCNAAINRWCAAAGMTTGFGPAEHSGETLTLVCTPRAVVFETSYTALAEHVSTCDGTSERTGDRCSEAFHRWCRAQGYESGYGPLENSGDLAYAACLGGAG